MNQWEYQGQQGLVNQVVAQGYFGGCYKMHLESATIEQIKAELERRVLEAKAKEQEIRETERVLAALKCPNKLPSTSE